MKIFWNHESPYGSSKDALLFTGLLIGFLFVVILLAGLLAHTH